MASRVQTQPWRETVRAGAVRSGALVTASVLFALTVLLALALVSFDSRDAALSTAAGEATHNLIGAPGAWVADLLLMLVGPAVALLLPVPAIVGLRLWRGLPAGPWLRMLRNAIIGVVLMATALAFVSDTAIAKLPGRKLVFTNGNLRNGCIQLRGYHNVLHRQRRIPGRTLKSVLEQLFPRSGRSARRTTTFAK